VGVSALTLNAASDRLAVKRLWGATNARVAPLLAFAAALD
jgi:hypothetical protein